MQRDEKRVRWAAVGPALAGSSWLAFCAFVAVGFTVLLYAYGAMSCRPGGAMWQTIARYEGHEMLDMGGTWLALLLLPLRTNYGSLFDRTCGGTVHGRRPAPGLDLWVCAPVEDVRAEETFVVWKNSFGSLALLCGAFVLCSHAVRRTTDGSLEGEAVTERRWRFYLAFGLIWLFTSHGLLGGLLMLTIVLANFVFVRATARLPHGVVQVMVWVFVLLSMEMVFRLLGDHAHKIEGVHEDQGVRYWSLIEALVCGEEKLKNPKLSMGTVCPMSRPFILKGLCPWYLYRFTALKLISFSLDAAGGLRGVLSRVRALDEKPALVRATETNLAPEKYGLRPYLCYVFYVPTYAAGPILSYNAFVAQVETEQKPYSPRDLLFFGLRWMLFIVIIEVFTVIWWYSQKLHLMSCVPEGLYKECIFDDLSVWELFLATNVRLHYSWLGLIIIWRFGRLVALLDGIDTPENMLGCVSFNYTFEAFWRIWHSSMNRFMLRYLYNPLGGKARSWLAVPLVFAFVAYWHENTGFMTRPWWYLWAMMNAVGVTVEKALGDSVGGILARRAARGGPWAGLRLLARGLGPLALIVVNVPAFLFASTPRFYASLLLRGWPSFLLVVCLVGVYGCTAELVEALRDEQPPTARSPSGARSPQPLPRVSSAAESEAALPRRSWEAERQDPLMIELEDTSSSSWASALETHRTRGSEAAG